MWFLRALSRLTGLLPLTLVLSIGRGLGGFLYLFSRSRRSEILDRIQSSLDVDRKTAVTIVRGMYRNLGMTGMEVLRLPHVSEAEMRKRVRYVGAEKLPVDQGWVATVAHTGNWEYMAAAYPLIREQELAVVVKALKPPAFNDWLTAARGRWGTRVIDRRGSVREILKAVKQGCGLGFMMDQNAKRNWGIFVDFFGTPACTTDGLAQIAARTKVPVYPVFARRLDNHDHEVVIGEPIDGPADDSDTEILRVTREATQAVETFIREHPEQWIWMHRRWRTQPEPSDA